MWPVLISLWGFKVTVGLLYWVTALVWASFLIWQRMREDFTADDVFIFSIWLLAGALAGTLAESMGTVVLAIGVIWWWCKRKHWDFWELFDFLAVVGLWLWLGASISWGPGAVFDMAAAIVGIIFAWYVRSHYRNIRWYISGKVGLVGLSVLVFFALFQAMIAIFMPIKVYWGSLTVNQLIAPWVMAFGLIAIYLRSGRKASEDLSRLTKKKNEKS